MSVEQILIALLTLGSGILGWFGRVLWEAVQQLRKDLQALEVRIGTDYIRYDRLQDALRPIMQGLQEIKEALAHKADK